MGLDRSVSQQITSYYLDFWRTQPSMKRTTLRNMNAHHLSVHERWASVLLKSLANAEGQLYQIENRQSDGLADCKILLIIGVFILVSLLTVVCCKERVEV